MGFNDATSGSQELGLLQGGVRLEMHSIDPSNEIDSGFTLPTTLTTLQGWVGNACFSVGCLSGHMGSPITNMSLCAGPVLEISIGDASDDSLDDANSKFVAMVWGW